MLKPKVAEYEMFSFFERTPVMVWIAGKDGYLRKINPAVTHKLGYTNEEMFSRPVFSFMHPDDVEKTGKERAELLNGKPLIDFQNRYVKKNGSIIWLEWRSIYLEDKEVVFAMANDITERKEREIELEEKFNKFKTLATHFKHHVEEDRKKFAYELHEELAQLAVVIKMNVSWMSKNVTGMSEDLKTKVDETLIITDLFMNTIKRISFSISPNMLNDLGFNAAIEWQCREFSILNGIPCNFSSNCDEEILTYELKIDFFRICQEALGNIMKHASARNVKITLADTCNNVTLKIIDDGMGFDVMQQTHKSGLIKMKQRAVSINSKLIIESEPGKGTSVIVITTKN